MLLLGVVGCYLSYRYRAGIGDNQHLITSLFAAFTNNRVYFFIIFASVKHACKHIFLFRYNISFSSTFVACGNREGQNYLQ